MKFASDAYISPGLLDLQEGVQDKARIQRSAGLFCHQTVGIDMFSLTSVDYEQPDYQVVRGFARFVAIASSGLSGQ